MKPLASTATSRQRFRFFEQQSRGVEARASLTPLSPRSLGPLVRRYFDWVRPHRQTFAAVILFSLGSLVIDLFWPLAWAGVIDGIVLNPAIDSTRKVQLIGATCVLILVISALNSTLRWRLNLNSQTLGLRLSFELRSRLLQHVLRLPLSVLTETRVGSVQSLLSTDVENATGLLQQAAITPFLASLRLVLGLAITFALDARIAAFVVLISTVVIVGHLVQAMQLRPIWRSVEQDRRNTDGRVTEALGGIRVVRAFRREKREELAFATGLNTVIRKQLLAGFRQRRVSLLWDGLLPTVHILSLGFGGYLVTIGETSVGVLMATQNYIWRILDPIAQIAGSISATQRGFASLEHIIELLDRTPEESGATVAHDAPATITQLRFENVGFEYTPGAPVITDFSLTVERGSIVALVGPSGAGKSTLLDLVARFRDPTRGTIRLNGIDLRDIRLKSYRARVGIVSQDDFLFDGTIADNIAYGRPRGSRNEIAMAAKLANAHEFIDRLPEGYDTVVGERGVKLSGGQRQRLSIARALLTDPELLLLDESTSNLDLESERIVHDSLRQLAARRLTFVISHRLSTIRQANVIVVLVHGRVAECGTHRELMAARGKYYALVNRQRRDAEDVRITEEETRAELQTNAE